MKFHSKAEKKDGMHDRNIKTIETDTALGSEELVRKQEYCRCFSELPEELKRTVRASYFYEMGDRSHDAELDKRERRDILVHMLSFLGVCSIDSKAVNAIVTLFETSKAKTEISEKQRMELQLRNLSELLRGILKLSYKELQSYLFCNAGITEEEFRNIGLPVMDLKEADTLKIALEKEREEEQNSSEVPSDSSQQENNPIQENSFEEEFSLPSTYVIGIEYTTGGYEYWEISNTCYMETVSIMKDLLEENVDGHIQNPVAFMKNSGVTFNRQIPEEEVEEIDNFYMMYQIEQNLFTDYGNMFRYSMNSGVRQQEELKE